MVGGTQATERRVKNTAGGIHVISPDFGGSSRFGAFPPGLTLGRRNLPTRGFSNVIFSDRISVPTFYRLRQDQPGE